jgi:hypothetical protein
MANVKFSTATRSSKTKTPTSYTNKKNVVFHSGDTVKLTEKAFQTNDASLPTFAGRRITKGKITSLLADVKGLVVVEPRLGGFYTWNVDDLEKVETDAG